MKLSEAIAILAAGSPSPAEEIIRLVAGCPVLNGAARQATADAALLGVLCLK